MSSSSTAQNETTTPLTTTTATTYLLTGDIGGTNSRMSLYDASSTNCQQDKPLVVKYFRNAKYLPKHVRNEPNAFQQHIIVPFLKHCWEGKETEKTTSLVDLKDCQIVACLATAGLVMNNRVNMTNLDDLLVDGNAIAAADDDDNNEYLKRIVVCRIINDFVAQGYGCLTLQPKEVKLLHGPSQYASSSLKHLPVGPKVCVGAGTGLGECYLTPNNNTLDEQDDDDDDDVTYSCFPSEGGHVEYAPRNALEIKMWQYMSDRYASKKRISVERVVSGIGLANVYEFLAQEYPDQIDTTVHEKFLQAGDEQGRVVAENAKPATLCLHAMDIMMSAYGCEVGSAAIKWIPLGGLFVTGGLTPKNIHHIQGANSEFMKSYLHKGRVSPMLEKIPLFAVMVEDLGVRGAHKAALMEYERFIVSENGGTSTWKKRRAKKLSSSASLAVAVIVGFLSGAIFSRMRR